jgi:hypothetical protein
MITIIPRIIGIVTEIIKVCVKFKCIFSIFN